jgi:monooxygenase
MHLFPKQGDREPWINTQDYRRDKKMFHNDTFDNGALVFSSPAADSEGETEESLPLVANSGR